MSIWINLEIVGTDEPIRYERFSSAVRRVERLRLARNPLTGRNPMTGEPIEIPLTEPIPLVEYRDEGGNWYHALEFLPFDREMPLAAGTEGRIVGNDHLYPLRTTDTVVQDLARALDAEAREVGWTL